MVNDSGDPNHKGGRDGADDRRKDGDCGGGREAFKENVNECYKKVE